MKKQNKKFFRRAAGILLTVCMILALLIPAAANDTAAGKLPDYSGHWAKSFITAFLERGIISADKDGSIAPDEKITRGELAHIINGTFGLTKKAETPFTDIEKSHPYYDDMLIAKGENYMKGDGKGNGMADQNITRQDFAIVLGRLIAITPDSAKTESFFKDTAEMTEEGKGYIGTLAEKNIIQGYQKKFNPKNNISRAETVKMIFNSECVYGKKAYANIAVGENEKYGSEAMKPVTVNDLTVTGKGASVTNIIIEGDLIIAKAVGIGDVSLKNVQVKGSLIVRGGGKDSIHTYNCVFGQVIIDDETGAVRIVLDSNCRVGKISFLSGGRIVIGGAQIGGIYVDKEINAGLLSSVIIEGNADSVFVEGPVNLSLAGNFGSVTVSEAAAASVLTLGTGTYITNLNLGAPVIFGGTGYINTLSGPAAKTTTIPTDVQVGTNTSNVPAPTVTDPGISLALPPPVNTPKVRLGQYSLGVAGNGCITGLESGKIYLLYNLSTDEEFYIDENGIPTTDFKDVAPLNTGVIAGLSNDTTYSVYEPYNAITNLDTLNRIVVWDITTDPAAICYDSNDSDDFYSIEDDTIALIQTPPDNNPENFQFGVYLDIDNFTYLADEPKDSSFQWKLFKGDSVTEGSTVLQTAPGSTDWKLYGDSSDAIYTSEEIITDAAGKFGLTLFKYADDQGLEINIGNTLGERLFVFKDDSGELTQIRIVVEALDPT